MNDRRNHRADPRRDDGSVLPIVLVVIVVLGLVVAALATYTSTTLRYGQVVESSADRLATANAATENALEAIDRGASECILSGQASLPGGYTYTLAEPINGITAEINCEVVAGDLSSVDQFAVIMTGLGAGRNGPLLSIIGGASEIKKFTGPVFMAGTPDAGGPAPGTTLELQAGLEIDEGDLWYSASSCPGAVDLYFEGGKEVTFSAPGYGARCVDDDWLNPFLDAEPVPALSGLVDRTAPISTTGDCTVWAPGRYTTPPNVGDPSYPKYKGVNYHFFQSGFYYFDNFAGPWTIADAWVLMGGPGPSGPGVPGGHNNLNINTNPCKDEWEADDQTGAALYLDDAARVVLGDRGNLEITGRVVADYEVGLQALDSSTVEGDAAILSTTAGNDKQLSIAGLVWAPRAAFNFEGVTNTAVAALSGGAVVGELAVNVSASATDFVIGVDTAPSVSRLLLTASATNTGTTTVQTLLDFRTDDTYAVLSRRVVGLTQE